LIRSAAVGGGLAVLGLGPAIAQVPATSVSETVGQGSSAAKDAEQELVLQGDQGFAVALQALVQAGQFGDALALLESRPDLLSRPDATRLRAQLLILLEREGEALELLEGHLTRSPDDALARFQLAELHFARGRDGPARLAYDLALAGRLDPIRIQLANIRLGDLQERGRWRFSIGASIAPDSNLNSATSARQVELFGLPFDLDENARRRSGVSVSGFGGIERRFAVSPGMRVRTSLTLAATDAPGITFDDHFVGVRAGPEFRLGGGGRVSIEATGNWRWFGGDPLETGAGMRVETDLRRNANTRWSFNVSAEQIDAQLNQQRDGWRADVEAARTRFLGPTSFWRLELLAGHREAAGPSESYGYAQLSAGRLFAIPFNSTLYLEPRMIFRDFEGSLAAFGETRSDQEYAITARASKRDWVVFGAFPFVSATLVDSNSNVRLNDFSRERFELGFTRFF
jgi:outer membrane protein